MSFGKRRQDPVESRPSQNVANTKAPAPPRRTGRSPLLILAGIAVGFAIIAGLNDAYTTGMRHAGKKLNEKFEAQMNETVRPTPQHALLKTTAADGWTLGNCRMQQPPSAKDNVIPDKYAERDASHDGMLESAGGDISVALGNSAGFIDCVASYEGSKMCNAEVRTAFASDIARFYREHAVTSLEFQRNRNPQDEEFRAVLAEIEGAHPNVSIARDAVDTELRDALNKVDGALRSAIAGGIVAAEDFGWFAPVPVTEMFERTKAIKTPCAN